MVAASASRVPPALDPVNETFWTCGPDGPLQIQLCGACERFVHPPVPACAACGGELGWRAVSGRGTVFTFTVNRYEYRPDVPPPYVVAIVELVEQADLRFTTNVVGCDVDAVHIGMEVAVEFEPAGDAWVPVFRPAAAGQ